MAMPPARLSSELPSENHEERTGPPREEIHLLKEDMVQHELFDEPEPLEEQEQKLSRNQSAMDLYLKDPALRRPLLNNEKQRALFAKLSEARTTYSQEITRHPVVLV